MIKLLLKTLWHLLAVVGLVTVVAVVWMATQGVSARDEPAALETTVARHARSWAVPAAARSRVNPEPDSSDTIRAALEHWADHCASCHGNDETPAPKVDPAPPHHKGDPR